MSRSALRSPFRSVDRRADRRADRWASPWSFVSALALIACDAAPGPLDAAVARDAGPCVPFAFDEGATASERASCAFGAGTSPLTTLGLAQRPHLPIDRVVIVMQENRSFDHYFGRLPEYGHLDVDGIPADYVNLDRAGNAVAPFHLDSTCLEADPPHQWNAMHAQWNGGAMDSFVRVAAINGSDGRYAIGFHDESDLPFYYWLARTFAISDRHFGSVLGGTWANRNVLYTGSTYGVRDTGQRTIPDAATIFDRLDEAGVGWGVYTDGAPRQDSLGWRTGRRGVHTFATFLDEIERGALPPLSFVDPGPAQDEHPANDVQRGEQWSRAIYEAARQSPHWPSLALIYTYDEGGGIFDHVPPPAACPPSPDLPELARLGHRIPLIVVSPWARAGYVSHEVSAHESILRFVELLFDLPALTARDANARTILDLFELDCAPDFAVAPPAPPAGSGGC